MSLHTRKTDPDHHSVTDSMKKELLPSESRFMEVFHEYGRKIVYIIIGLIAFFVIMYRMSSGSAADALSDYINAQRDFQRFHQSASNEVLLPGGAYDKLVAILKRRPELHAKYDGLIAETLLVKQEAERARSYADSALERTKKNHLDFYTSFAQTTLLIAEGNYMEASYQSLNLQKKMEENGASQAQDSDKRLFGDELYLFNLLRIALLQQQIGSTDGELVAWQNLLHLMQPESKQGKIVVKPESIRAFLANFQEGDISLISYIETRLKLLTKK